VARRYLPWKIRESKGVRRCTSESCHVPPDLWTQVFLYRDVIAWCESGGTLVKIREIQVDRAASPLVQILALPESIWAQQCDGTGLFFTQKLMQVYRTRSTST
jgi:hypothetical protein